MPTLCWKNSLPPKELGDLPNRLQAAGFEIQWIEPVAMVEAFRAGGAVALLWSGGSRDELTHWLAFLRAQNDPALKFLPVLWMHSDDQQAELDAWIELGIDDCLSVHTPSQEIIARLKIRARDAAQRIRLDAELKAHAVITAKNETILKQREEFLSVCAHDLRSPLGLVQTSLSLFLDSAEAKQLPVGHVELLARAKRQAAHGITLVSDLLDVMAFEQGLKPLYQLINLHELLTEFYSDYRVQAEQKGVQFHYKNVLTHWRVLADSNRIRQLLQNLFTNALKFTATGKNIYLRVTPFEGRRTQDPPHPMLVLSVRDEGTGIPQKEIQKIFDKFTQIRDYAKPEGRGLGLTVAKQITALHDGNIWVESVEGKGSTFYVLLPHVVSRTTPAEEPRRGKKRLIVVEPNTEKRNRFVEWKQWGYDILFAKDGVEAVTLCYHFLPVGLVLTPALTKLPESEVFTLIRSDALLSNVGVFLAVDEGQWIDKAWEGPLKDAVIRFPTTKEELEQRLSPLKAVAAAVA